jgi:hypothetical protein
MKGIYPVLHVINYLSLTRDIVQEWWLAYHKDREQTIFKELVGVICFVFNWRWVYGQLLFGFFVQSLSVNCFEVMQMLKRIKNIHFRFRWSLKPGLVCSHFHGCLKSSKLLGKKFLLWNPKSLPMIQSHLSLVQRCVCGKAIYILWFMIPRHPIRYILL